MSSLFATILTLALGFAIAAALMAIALRAGRARGAPLAPTRHARRVRMADPST